MGAPELVAAGDLPALDLAYVKEKVRLAGGVWLSLRDVVLVRYREDVPSSTPGLDLLARTTDPQPAFVRLDSVPLVNRMCFPIIWSRLSVTQLDKQRPQELYPGRQNCSYDLQQPPGCVNGSTAPYLRRCWATLRMYWDVATMGFAYGPTGRPEATNYYVVIRNSSLLCARIMPEDCANRYGPIACYYTIFPKNNGTSAAAAAAAAAADELAAAAAAAAGGGGGGNNVAGDGGGGGVQRGVIGGLLGGVMGGVVLLGVVAVAAAAAWRRRRSGSSKLLLGAAAAAAAGGGAPTATIGGVDSADSVATESGRVMARPCNDSRRSWRKRPAAGGNGEGKAEGDDDDPSGDLTTGVRVERSSCDKGKDDTGRRRRRTTDGDGGSETTEPELSAMAAPSPLHWGREPSVAAGGGSRGSGERGGADCAVVTAAAAATAEVVITAATPPRADMMLLNGHQQLKHDEAEVKLLPNACLGKGSFGRVVAGVYRGQKVAVKVLAEVHVWGAWAGGPSDAVLRSFAQEVEVLGRCCHPNVVRLLAACLTPPRLCLVMELMDASLEGLLYEQRRPASAAAAAGSGSRSAVAAGSGSASSGGSGGAALLPLPTVLHIGLEIAKGLEYLHPTIVHRDLKPANVLLNNPWSSRPIVKITDFGVSRLRSTAIPTNTPQAGTPAYLAPEGMYCKSGIITHQADIYSLAVLLWEMLSGERPWRHFARGGLVEIAFNIVARGWRLPLEQLPEARCPPRLRHLIRQCWDADPRRRPAAAEVAKSLALLLQEAEHLQTAAGASSSDPAAAAATAAAAAAAAAGEQLLAAPPKALAPASAAAAPQTQQHLGVAVAVAAAAAAPAGDTALGVGGSIDGEPAGQGVFDRVLEAKMHLAAIGEYCSLTSSAAEALGAAHRIGAETISLTAACFRPVQDAAAAAAPKPAETHGIIGGPHNHHNRHNHLHEAVAAAAAMDATPLAATSSQAAAAAAGASSIVLLWSMTTGGTVACLPTADC